jgi:hypothetical protein
LANFSTIFANVVDTGGKFATVVNDTAGKFATGVSLTPVANLELRISLQIFEKNRNGPNGIIRGFGETDSRKKPEAKNLVTLSLYILRVGLI